MQRHPGHAVGAGDVCAANPVLIHSIWQRFPIRLRGRAGQMVVIHRRPIVAGKIIVRVADVEIGHAVASVPAFQVVGGGRNDRFVFVVGNARGRHAQAKTKSAAHRHHAIHVEIVELSRGQARRAGKGVQRRRDIRVRGKTGDESDIGNRLGTGGEFRSGEIASPNHIHQSSVVDERFQIARPGIDVVHARIGDFPGRVMQKVHEISNRLQLHESVLTVVSDVAVKNIGAIAVKTVTAGHVWKRAA